MAVKCWSMCFQCQIGGLCWKDGVRRFNVLRLHLKDATNMRCGGKLSGLVKSPWILNWIILLLQQFDDRSRPGPGVKPVKQGFEAPKVIKHIKAKCTAKFCWGSGYVHLNISFRCGFEHESCPFFIFILTKTNCQLTIRFE